MVASELGCDPVSWTQRIEVFRLNYYARQDRFILIFDCDRTPYMCEVLRTSLDIYPPPPYTSLLTIDYISEGRMGGLDKRRGTRVS